MPDIRKVSSSQTLPGLEKLINEYFYSSQYSILKGRVYHLQNGYYDKGVITKGNGRYYFGITVGETVAEKQISLF